MNQNERALVYRKTRRVIGIIAGLLAILFLIILFRNLKMYKAINCIGADFIWGFSLSIYFVSWVKGTLVDTDLREDVHLDFPNDNKRLWEALGVVALLAVAAIALCWTESNLKEFSITLIIFMLVDYSQRGVISSGNFALLD
jgi:hypothetical protein